MKIIAIGDIHAKKIWKHIVEKEKDADKIIFVGDYFDSFNKETADEQIQNFEEILSLKKENPDKYVLLIGNHDYHYLPEVEDCYSGYNAKESRKIGAVVSDALNKKLIQFCYVNYDKQHVFTIFTHAGITNDWAKSWLPINVDIESLESSVNNLPLKAFRFYPHDDTYYGQHVMQSPIWVRPESLVDNILDFDHTRQVFGHTKCKTVSYFLNTIMIDCLDYSNGYLEIFNNYVRTKEI